MIIPRCGRLFAGLLIWLPLVFSAGCAAVKPPPGGDSGRLPGPAEILFSFYRDGLGHMAAVRTGSCPMHPSCSSYSREAVSKHGLLVGWWMTCDRLIRCGRDEMDLSPRVMLEEGWRVYDPVSRNDYWWYDPAGGDRGGAP